MQKYKTFRSELQPNDGFGDSGPVEVYLADDVEHLEKALREAMTLIERARDFPDDIRGHIDDDIEDFKKEHSGLMDR